MNENALKSQEDAGELSFQPNDLDPSLVAASS